MANLMSAPSSPRPIVIAVPFTEYGPIGTVPGAWCVQYRLVDQDAVHVVSWPFDAQEDGLLARDLFVDVLHRQNRSIEIV